MSKALDILKSAYKKQADASGKLREIYNVGKDLTTEQRNELLGTINNQDAAALTLHNLIQNFK